MSEKGFISRIHKELKSLKTKTSNHIINKLVKLTEQTNLKRSNTNVTYLRKSQSTREMQMKTPLRFISAVRMAPVKTALRRTCAERREAVLTSWWECKLGSQ